MADTPILNYKGKYDGPEIDKAVELALGLDNPKSCPYYVHVSLSQPDYVLTIGLGDSEGNLFNHTEIDLPLESMVVNATYENGNIILHLQDGTSTEPIPISALIAGLVSETRTIAGIDLKDDITQKELRDALDVYTKDSVDQLVSDLENRIDETLNDLSELTSEHDTQIKKNTSDIAINHTTLGIQCKNLFNKDGEINSTYSGNVVSISSDEYNTVNGNVITFNRNSSNVVPTGQFIRNLKNKKIIVSFNVLSFGTGSVASFRIYKRGSSTALFNEYPNKIGAFKYRIDIGEEEILVAFGTSGGKGMQIENLMVRYAEIEDDSYEPYKPSVNERLIEVENSVEQNTNDIQNVRGLFYLKQSGVVEKTFTYDASTLHGRLNSYTGALLVTLYDWSSNIELKENLYLVSWNGGVDYIRVQPILESNTRLSLTSVTSENNIITFIANTSSYSITPLHAGTRVT